MSTTFSQEINCSTERIISSGILKNMDEGSSWVLVRTHSKCIGVAILRVPVLDRCLIWSADFEKPSRHGLAAADLNSAFSFLTPTQGSASVLYIFCLPYTYVSGYIDHALSLCRNEATPTFTPCSIHASLTHTAHACAYHGSRDVFETPRRDHLRYPQASFSHHNHRYLHTTSSACPSWMQVRQQSRTPQSPASRLQAMAQNHYSPSLRDS